MTIVKNSKTQEVSQRIGQICDILNDVKLNADAFKNIPGLRPWELTIDHIKELFGNAVGKVANKRKITRGTVGSKYYVQLKKVGKTEELLSSDEFYRLVLRWIQGDGSELKAVLERNEAQGHEIADDYRIGELFR